MKASERGARGTVGLTFDDDYANFASTIVPILTPLGFTTTVYALGGLNERVADAATPEQVREIFSAGMEVGSPGLRHVFVLTPTPHGLTAGAQLSRVMRRQLLGEQVFRFAYPYVSVTTMESVRCRPRAIDMRAVSAAHGTDQPRHRPEALIGQRNAEVRMPAIQIKQNCCGGDPGESTARDHRPGRWWRRAAAARPAQTFAL
ncbi:MAG: polysaccharide deacetylase family protein [Pseudonocardiales bacterium]|nr:polysaccharide deacetylase family protein [Pseudonocardiales bacterium]